VAPKKVGRAGLSPEALRGWIEADHESLSISRQCGLLGLARSSCYDAPCGETPENLALRRRLDEEYLRTPFYGSRKLAVVLGVNRKRMQRLMGIAAVGPKRRTTRPGAGHKVYPYLLRNVEISRPDQVWSTDITYIPLRGGFLYLVAIMDWFSRYVLSWRLSNTLEGTFCCEALEEALALSRPEIFNSEQGRQFTAVRFTQRLRVTATERFATPAAGVGFDGDEVVALFDEDQCPFALKMAGLSAGCFTALFSLRRRLGVRMLKTGWQGRIAGRLIQAGFEFRNTRIEFGDPRQQQTNDSLRLGRPPGDQVFRDQRLVRHASGVAEISGLGKIKSRTTSVRGVNGYHPSYKGPLPSNLWHYNHKDFTNPRTPTKHCEVLWNGYRSGTLYQAHARL
jgi:putative transposase